MPPQTRAGRYRVSRVFDAEEAETVGGIEARAEVRGGAADLIAVAVDAIHRAHGGLSVGGAMDAG
jgi:hypothetical protein